jgi:hypothetical protein
MATHEKMWLPEANNREIHDEEAPSRIAAALATNFKDVLRSE